jgi:hypothetical protein
MIGPNDLANLKSMLPGILLTRKIKTDRDGSHQKDLDRVRRFKEAAWAATVGLL